MIDEIFPDLAMCLGVSVDPVSAQEWWTAIQADEQNPCLTIQGYIEEAIVRPTADQMSKISTPPTLDISGTLKLTPNSLAKCPPLDKRLWARYLEYWRESGFIGK